MPLSPVRVYTRTFRGAREPSSENSRIDPFVCAPVPRRVLAQQAHGTGRAGTAMTLRHSVCIGDVGSREGGLTRASCTSTWVHATELGAPYTR